MTKPNLSDDHKTQILSAVLAAAASALIGGAVALATEELRRWRERRDARRQQPSV